MSILSVNHLLKNYGAHAALSDIHFELDGGRIMGLLGPNGAGKTTLIRIITGILQADSGTVAINQLPLRKLNPLSVGYLPEERGLYKKMRVGEQIQYLASLKGLSKSAAKQSWEYWAEKLSVKEWEEKFLEDLSKGMQQKVQFIACLIHNPDLIILDEPFTGFDPVNANLMKKVIIELKDQGKAIILATHRMETVEELCDQLIFLNNGKIVLNKSKAELFESYRSRSYTIETDKAPDLPSFAKIISSEYKTDRLLSTIQLDESAILNQLLEYLLPQVQVFGIKEEIPSMNDIFIQLVK